MGKRSRSPWLPRAWPKVETPKTSSFDEWDGSGWWDSHYGNNYLGTTGTGRSVSSYWKSRFTWDVEETPKDEENYADALRDVRRTANVLPNSIAEEKDIEVKWSDGTARNTSSSSVVYLSPDILSKNATRQKEWELEARKDVLVAEALAESVMKRTVSRNGERIASSVATTGSPVEAKLRHYVWRAAERVVAESEVAKDYPGFTGYFAKSRDYFTDPNAADTLQQMLDTKESAVLVTQALLWEMLHPEKHLKLSQKAAAAVATAHQKILSAKKSAGRAQAAVWAVKHFLELWPPEKEPSGTGPDNGSEESQPNGDGSDVREGNLDRELKEAPHVGIEKRARDELIQCSVDADDLKDVEYEHQEWPDLCTWTGGVETAVLPPTSYELHYYKQLVKLLAPQISALRNRLKLRAEETKLLEHGLRRGRLDEGSLHKLCLATQYNLEEDGLFEAEEIVSQPTVAFLLLLDESGSMGEEGKYIHARNTAITIANAVRALPGVAVAVMGHTGCGSWAGPKGNFEGVGLHEYLSPRQPKVEALARISSYGWNIDGYAIAHAVNRLVEWYPHHERKVLVHISDGLPRASNGKYSGRSAMRHIRAVVNRSAQMGVRVTGIGLGSEFSAVSGKEMYGAGNFIHQQSNTAMHVVANLLVEAVNSRRAAA